MWKVSFLWMALCLALVDANPVHNSENLRLIKTSESGPAQWLSENEILSLIDKHHNFIDVTDHTFPINKEDPNTKNIPTTLRFNSTVNALISGISASRLTSFVANFSSYHNRHYASVGGVQSQVWLLHEVTESAVDYIGNITASEFSHSWAQSSVIARIDGSDPLLKNEVVVIGAHIDSINGRGATLAAPGADDNASGAAVVLETLRILVEAGYVPKRSLEFHFYAAEEVGLRGSQAIAASYDSQGVNVVAMVNFDIPGFYTGGRDEIALYTDYTNGPLNAFLRLVTLGYLDFGWVNRICGYGCSDHASWHGFGFPAAFPAELVDHPDMHTANDVIARVNFRQVEEFVKLALGVMVEISEPANTMASL